MAGFWGAAGFCAGASASAVWELLAGALAAFFGLFSFILDAWRKLFGFESLTSTELKVKGKGLATGNSEPAAAR